MKDEGGLQIMRISDDIRIEWDDFVGMTEAAGFMQSWGWGEFKRTGGQQVVRLGVRDEDGRLCAAAAVYYVVSSSGVSPLTLPHGPVFCLDRAKAFWAAEILTAELKLLAAEVRSPAIRVEPFAAELPMGMGEGFVRAPVDLVPTPTRLISVDRSDEELLAGMESKGRYNVRLAIKKGVTVSSFSDKSAVQDFYSLFELTSLRHGFSGEAVAFFENLIQGLGSQGMVRIYVAHYQGMAAAAAVVVLFGRRVTYLYGGSAPFLGSVMAPYAIHWRIMQDARAAGCAEYDLYGVAPDDMPFHPYARFSQFKSRFGGRVFAPVGAHDLYCYSQIAGMWVDNLLAMRQ